MIRVSEESEVKRLPDLPDANKVETTDPAKTLDPTLATPAEQIARGLVRSAGSDDDAGSSVVAILNGQTEPTLSAEPPPMTHEAIRASLLRLGYSPDSIVIEDGKISATRVESNGKADITRAETWTWAEFGKGMDDWARTPGDPALLEAVKRFASERGFDSVDYLAHRDAFMLRQTTAYWKGPDPELRIDRTAYLPRAAAVALAARPADLRTRAEERIQEGYRTTDGQLHDSASKALRHERETIDGQNAVIEAFNEVERLLPTAGDTGKFRYGGVYVQHSREAIDSYVAALHDLLERLAGKAAAERFDQDPRTALPLQHDESGPLRDLLDRLVRIDQKTSTEWGQPFLVENRPPKHVQPVDAASIPGGTKLVLTPKIELDASKVTLKQFRSSDGSLSLDREQAIERQMLLIRAEDAGALLAAPRFGLGASFQHPIEAAKAFRSAVLGLAREVLGDEAVRRVSIGEPFSADRDADAPPFLRTLLDRLARIDPEGREWPHALGY
jgi:hypothetical protein